MYKSQDQIILTPKRRLEVQKETLYTMYQVQNNERTKNIQFVNYAYFESKRFQPDFENYEKIYEGLLGEEINLENIRTMFNENIPLGSNYRKLSRSDIIVIDNGVKTKAYYIDKEGYVEIPSFAVDHDLSLGKSIDIVDYLEKPTRVSGKDKERKPGFQIAMLKKLNSVMECSK